MFQAVSGWFPDTFFANLYGIIVLAALLSDELVPRLAGGRGISYGGGRDRGSFILIYLSSLVGLGVSIFLRFQNIGVVPVWVQGLALVLLIMYASIVLGLGTWVGALFMLMILLFPTLYRIRVEEKALLDTFGDEYRTCIQRTWRLFPKW
jgi:protein-S-isoprenylcysteine O-methyltransferase Ste14